MWPEIEFLRKLILSKIPPGTIVPEHTSSQHFYRYMPLDELYPSVTTKSEVLGENHLKKWAANKSVDYIRDNWQRANTSNAERELVFLEAGQSHVNIFEDAGDIGTRIHTTVERYLNEWLATNQQPKAIVGFLPNTETDTRVISAVRGAEKFFNERHVLPVFSELLVASPKYKIAGTLDFLAYIGKEVVGGNKDCVHKELWQSGKSPYRMACLSCPLRIKYELNLVDFKSSNQIIKPKYMMQVATYWQCLAELTGVKPKRTIIVGLDKKAGDYLIESITDFKRKTALKAYLHLIKTYDWLNSPHSEFESKTKKILEI